jgi:hypothetical protein
MKLKQALTLIDRYSPATLPEFDYSGLAPEIAASARTAAERIKARIKASVLDTGRDLLAVKEQLEYGQFQEWLACEFNMTPRSAQNYMQAARAFDGKSEIVSHLPQALIYRLAAPATPAPLREELVRRFESGERIHAGEVEGLIKAARQSERKCANRQRAEEQDREKRAAFLAKLPERERARLLKKEHRQELKQAQRRAELEAEEQRREQEHARREERAREAVEMLQQRLGSEFARFVELVLAGGSWAFVDMLKAAVAPPAPLTAREHRVRALKKAAGLARDGSANADAPKPALTTAGVEMPEIPAFLLRERKLAADMEGLA